MLHTTSVKKPHTPEQYMDNFERMRSGLPYYSLPPIKLTGDNVTPPEERILGCPTELKTRVTQASQILESMGLASERVFHEGVKRRIYVPDILQEQLADLPVLAWHSDSGARFPSEPQRPMAFMLRVIHGPLTKYVEGTTQIIGPNGKARILQARTGRITRGPWYLFLNGTVHRGPWRPSLYRHTDRYSFSQPAVTDTERPLKYPAITVDTVDTE